MSYSEVRGTRTHANGTTTVKTTTSKIVGTFDATSQNTVPLLLKKNQTAYWNIDITSGTGTFQLQSSPVGSSNWMPTAYNGSNDISADAAGAFNAPADTLFRIASTAASSLAATVTITI